MAGGTYWSESIVSKDKTWGRALGRALGKGIGKGHWGRHWGRALGKGIGEGHWERALINHHVSLPRYIAPTVAIRL